MVILILGVLGTVTVFAVRGVTSRGEQSACVGDARTLTTAANAWMDQESRDEVPALGSSPDRYELYLVDVGMIRQVSLPVGTSMPTAPSPPPPPPPATPAKRPQPHRPPTHRPPTSRSRRPWSLGSRPPTTFRCSSFRQARPRPPVPVGFGARRSNSHRDRAAREQAAQGSPGAAGASHQVGRRRPDPCRHRCCARRTPCAARVQGLSHDDSRGARPCDVWSDTGVTVSASRVLGGEFEDLILGESADPAGDDRAVRRQQDRCGL